jgi:hypothetical protein
LAHCGPAVTNEVLANGAEAETGSPD